MVHVKKALHKAKDHSRVRLFLILIILPLFIQALCGCSLKSVREDSDEGLLSIKERERLAEELHTKGLTLDAEGKLEDAIDTWLKEIDISPKRVRPYNNIGIAYRRLGNLDSAKEFHQKAITIDPKFGHSYYSFGLVYYDRKNYEKAKELFGEAIKREYSNADVYYSLGQANKNLGEYEQAITAYEKTAKLYYSYRGAHYQLGECHRSKGKYDLARLEFKREISLNSSWKYLCEIGLQEIEVELEPNNADKLFALGMLHKDSATKDHRERAMKTFSMVIYLNPAYPDAHFQLGYLRQLSGDPDGAEHEYEKEIQINPTHIKAGKALDLLKMRKHK